jgi:aminoglycoside/choline kinase family phosphotransferase/dTDP-glucose pyrophosphorylase
MKALILAAGFGTRLAPHTDILPKALFPVAGTPVLGRMIANLKRAGCTAIAVNAHHLAHQIRAYLEESDFGLPVFLSREAQILGTGGAVRQLADFWDEDPFMVVNADIVTDIDLAAVYRQHQLQGARVTLVMHDRPPFNQVWVNRRRRITGFARLMDAAGSPRHRKMAFTGIQVMERGIIRRITTEGFCDMITVYQRMLEDGIPIHAHIVRRHYWQDIGSPDRFRDAVVDAMAPGAFRTAFGGDQDRGFRCRRLSGDGSDRGWYRLTAGRHRLIMADHGITTRLPGSEVNAFVQIGTHLRRCGLPVPRIYAHDAFSGLVFVEDLGSRHLQQAVLRNPNATRIETRYRRVIDTLLDLTAKAADGFDPEWTCQSRAYDSALILEKECRYFVEAFLNGYLEMAVTFDEMAAEFDDLARHTLEHGVAGLIHRDFQSRNILIRDNRHYLIDFQGARSGPVQYDLASLLIDPYAGLGRNLQERLLHYAAGQAEKRLHSHPDPKRFIRGYRYCAVTRNLQMLGAFGYLSRVKQKTAFETWIPPAAAMLADHLRTADAAAWPKLQAVAGELVSIHK